MTQNTFRRLTAAELDALQAREELRLLDSRDEGSFQREHIEGATRVHQGNLDALIRTTPRDQALLIYCYHGISSQQYAGMFADFGFTRVHDLIGGYEAWRAHAASRPAGGNVAAVSSGTPDDSG